MGLVGGLWATGARHHPWCLGQEGDSGQVVLEPHLDFPGSELKGNRLQCSIGWRRHLRWEGGGLRERRRDRQRDRDRRDGEATRSLASKTTPAPWLLPTRITEL